jgi:hypothetical protein
LKDKDKTPRQIVKALYVIPAILTLKAFPSFASSGSGDPQRAKHSKATVAPR